MLVLNVSLILVSLFTFLLAYKKLGSIMAFSNKICCFSPTFSPIPPSFIFPALYPPSHIHVTNATWPTQHHLFPSCLPSFLISPYSHNSLLTYMQTLKIISAYERKYVIFIFLRLGHLTFQIHPFSWKLQQTLLAKLNVYPEKNNL